ncbi:peptidase T [Aggregatibacter actinomycetemcomitans]|uniref:Peptidase T n=1 Tax=Aggregatibacter actinomycetemcomitans TaxID=714 RepID=A0A5D0EL40_AGGAC|nr:peptidase T [Aggregatibacter actinomycetemcomitans]AFI87859.1 peptidase T [Aggregatibacter actinomycetemcomitans D7S-1]AMQ94811.1 peptidase T [Aggregatibacter actinomycetemcomitans]ANU82974.1 peptidase T [Aggregatibacter actinomycetemcomitans]EKX93825.1 peptidase T [Aggregatibacter actinomycetemcomitans Y4]KND85780.1 peptidase T [Aggregatibacter actinomycetemcomitans serotype a str. H5P1]
MQDLLSQEPVLERFFNYVSYDTQSKPGARVSPSTAGQLALAKHLQQELIALGLQNIELSKHAVLTAFLPSNVDPDSPTIGLISHLDTSPECSGKNVQPELIENYRGGDIALGIGEEFISPVYYSFLHQLTGKTLIVTDGNTLLGADNKAGIAEIMTALYRLKTENLPHCNIRVAFTPDEEIGLGMQFFPFEDFPCDWAYTIDGGAVGELEYENFNAASAKITFHGRNIHPGAAKKKMVNALTLACEFQNTFPAAETPENTEQREGFFHLNHFAGDIEKVELHYLIRDFEWNTFEQRKQFITVLVEKFNREKRLPKPIELMISDSYKNMNETVKKVPQSIELADLAMQQCGVTPNHKLIRGGTDGAWLAEKGLACPNIFTGGYNFHSKHELITLEGMKDAVNVIVKLVELAAKAS